MSDRRLGGAIFLTFFSLYMLSSGREPAWGDARGMYYVGENIVSHGHIDLPFAWPEDKPRAADGKFYSVNPILPALMNSPGAVIKNGIVLLFPRSSSFVKPITTHLMPSALGALCCLLLFQLCRLLGAGQRASSLTALGLGAASTIWVYAHYPYSEILQAALYLGFFLQTMRVARDPTRRAALWLGVWAGLLFNAKYVLALPIAGGAAFIAWELRARRRELAGALAWATVAGLPFLALAAWYNWAREGSILRTGYEGYFYFGGSFFIGAWGQLLSPNKSAFLYSPPLLLAMFGLPAAWRRARDYLLALLLVFVPIFVLYATYKSWSGDYAWGPRFFVFAVPVLMAPLALLLERLAERWRPRARAALVAAVFGAGAAVQLLGISLYWDHFIRIVLEAKPQWLGKPNRAGSYIPDKGRGYCDSCFEDMHPIVWLPAFQPMGGTWWLLQSVVRGDDWQTAEAKAPWHEFTSLKLNIAGSYARARIDWWGLLWLRDFPEVKAAGAALLAIFLLGTLLPARVWWRGHRLARDPPL